MGFRASVCCVALCTAVVSSGMRLEAQQPAGAPQPAPASTITVNAQLVNLPVIVRDKKGAMVQNLSLIHISEPTRP